jgi:DNA topoisomerase-1
MDTEFTADVETHLDDIEEGSIEWEKVLREFWGAFEKALNEARVNMESRKIPPKETGEMCPNCGKPLVIRESRFGLFMGCSGYPKCKTVVNRGIGESCPVPECGGQMVETRPGSGRLKCSNAPACGFVSRVKSDNSSGEAAAPDESLGVCPNCGKPLVLRQGRFGEFLGCSGYPKCRTIISQPKSTGVKCPMEGCEGEIIERRSKRGKAFYGCDKYPGCSFVLWNRPVGRPCPQCGAMLVEKPVRNKPSEIACSAEGCSYKETAPESEE